MFPVHKFISHFYPVSITSHVTGSLNNVLLRCHLPLEKMLDNLNLTKINRNESYAGHHKLITFVSVGLINAADTSPIIIVVSVALLIDVIAPVVYRRYSTGPSALIALQIIPNYGRSPVL